VAETTLEKSYLPGLAGKAQQLFNMLRETDLRAASLRGSILSTAGFGVQKCMQLISNLILARILFPEAFGLMAIASVFLLGISMFSDMGIHPAIIQSKRGREQEFLETAWTIKVIRGFCICAASCVLAYPVSIIYQEPILFPLLCVLSITAILQGVSSTRIASLNRDMEFKRIVLIDLARDLLTPLITIALALWLQSVWALAFGSITGNFLRAVLSHTMLPGHQHRLRIDRQAAGDIIRFGKWILLATTANFIGGNGMPLIQGYLVSMQVLGLLTIAKTFVGALDELAAKLVSSVGFPAMSHVARECPDKFPAVIRKIRTVTNLVAVPCFLLLSTVASWMIELLYDSRYTEAGFFLSIMAVNGALGFMQLLYQSAHLARGDSQTHFLTVAAMSLFRCSGVVIGFLTGGVYGMLVGLCCGSLAAYGTAVIGAWYRGFACWRADLLTLPVIAIYVLVMFD